MEIWFNRICFIPYSKSINRKQLKYERTNKSAKIYIDLIDQVFEIEKGGKPNRIKLYKPKCK